MFVKFTSLAGSKKIINTGHVFEYRCSGLQFIKAEELFV